MIAACYILCSILAIWGGCLVARVIANRLEFGLFRRKLAGGVDGWTGVRRRSGWWTVVGVLALALGAAAAFWAHDADLDLSPAARPSSASKGVDNLLFAIGIASIGVSAGLVIVGWRFDPSLGRRRCPKCWYDMAGVQGFLCPECGRDAGSERRLKRSRRSWKAIVVAIVPLLLVPVTMRVLYAMRVGWMGLIPTSVMIAVWERLPEYLVGTPNSMSWSGALPAPGSLSSRVDEGDLAAWQRRWMAQRCLQMVESSDDPKITLRALEFCQVYWWSFDVESTPGTTLTRRMHTALLRHMRRLNDPDPGVRKAAVQLMYPAIAHNLVAFEDVRPHVLTALASQEDEAVSLALAWLNQSRASLKDAELDQIAKDLLDPQSSIQRRQAIIGFLLGGTLEPKIANGLLDAALSSNDESVRGMSHKLVGQFAAMSRGLSGAPANLGVRIQRAISDDVPIVAQNAAYGLLWSNDSNTAETRAAVLRRLDADEQALEALIPVLADALNAQKMREDEVLQAERHIIRALSSENRLTQEQALFIVERLASAPKGLRAAVKAYRSHETHDAGLRDRADRILQRPFWHD